MSQQSDLAKVEIRRRVLEALAPPSTRVFDAFAGRGLMYTRVWCDAAAYVGCDPAWHQDDRYCYVADPRRVLRCLDLARFNCFDLDAPGSPWEAALIIAARRPRLAPGELLGLVLTDGTSFTRVAHVSQVPPALREAAGLQPTVSLGTGRLQDELISRALAGLTRRLQGRIVRQWAAAPTTGGRVRYLSLVIEGERREA